MITGEKKRAGPGARTLFFSCSSCSGFVPARSCSAEEVNISLDQHDYYDNRQYPLEITFKGTGQFDAFTGVDFFQVVVKAPPVTGDAEKKVDQGADGKQVIAEDKVFQVQNHCPLS